MERLASLASLTPHTLPANHGWPVLIDGDGLAYTQSGPAGTSREQARMNVLSKIAAVRRRTGSDLVSVLLTLPESPKGGRYAVATVKPYQGQRSNSRRPENWAYLRSLLEQDAFNFPIIKTAEAEADDLFAEIAHKHGGNAVIMTQDKDMRMIPAVHLTWDDMLLVDNREGQDVVAWGLQYGARWFWLQMLHGDGADHIPGLPKYQPPTGKPMLVGEVTAKRLLDGYDDVPARVLEAYRTWYKDDAELHMLEQGILLWMRRNPADPFDVAHPEYGPLAGIMQPGLRDKIMERLQCASLARN